MLAITNLVIAQKDTSWRKTGRFNAWGVRYQTQTFGITENKLDTCNCGGAERGISDRGNVGLLISYYRSVNPRFSYSADLGFSYGKVSTLKVNTFQYKSKLFTSLRTDLYYHIGKERQLISPYLHTGLHGQIGSFYVSMPLGAGMRWMMKKSPVFLTTQIDYGVGLSASLRNNLITSLGLYVNLGSIKKAPARRSGGGYLDEKPACDTDTDMDGIPDLLDACPKLKGTKENNGCPSCDTDNDGIVDEKDKCPTVPGSMSNQGCPIVDTDGDGVVDEKDLCPTVPGKVSNNGCPELSPAAPATSSASSGVPAARKDIPEVIVYFDTDKFAIRKDAQAEIDRAVAFLSANTEYLVILKGHTDVRASFAYNEKLSQNRVEAVKAKLKAAGIAEHRIKIAHFGEVTPAKEGDGEPNWQKNRRVEFTFVIN